MTPKFVKQKSHWLHSSIKFANPAKIFTPFLESLPKNYCMIASPTLNRRTDMSWSLVLISDCEINSPRQYHRKYMDYGIENMETDQGEDNLEP